MTNVPFVKYTSCGNNFVIVDELDQQILSEAQKVRFAHEATSACFGVGSDNLLVVQRATSDVLRAISERHGYWKALPDRPETDFVFRMFEPDGREAFCCGNGLMCIADYLYQAHGVEHSQILTEIPRPEPKPVAMGRADDGSGIWVNVGQPRPTPRDIVDHTAISRSASNLDFVARITVPFRSHDLHPYSERTTLELSGHLVFTGEPHLVIEVDEGFSIPALSETLFTSSAPRHDHPGGSHARINYGSWLIHRIGSYVNSKLDRIFPAGLNIDFVRRVDGETLEYRCFERGIDRETLACGTGALAVAYVAKELGRISADSVTVLPHRCRWYEPQARLRVSGDDRGWQLRGTPVMLFRGLYQAGASLGSADGLAQQPIRPAGDDHPQTEVQVEHAYTASL